MRVGWGVDAHRFAAEGFVVLGGVIVDETRGVLATSDGDVAAHALTDAVLGAAALGDLGEFYPSSDPRWDDADSMLIPARRRGPGRRRRLSSHQRRRDDHRRTDPHRPAPRRDPDLTCHRSWHSSARTSVKATTTDSMGFLGRDEGIAALAVVVMEEQAPGTRHQAPGR